MSSSGTRGVDDGWRRWLARSPVLGPAPAGVEAPSRSELQTLVDPQRWRLVDPRSVRDGYESAVSRGEIPTRDHNWHDAFNVAAFVAWPTAKPALHAAVLAEQRSRLREGIRRRSRAEDALALLDEAVVVVSGPAAVLARFDDGRAHYPIDASAALATMDAAVRDGLAVRWFGHALLEHLALDRPPIDAGVWTVATDDRPAGRDDAAYVDCALAQQIVLGTFASPRFSPTIPWPHPVVLAWLDDGPPRLA